MLATKTAEIKATETTIQYREPGEGAVEFARQFVEGMTREEAVKIVDRLIKGELHDRVDRRVKRCDYCGYWWRDGSLRNTKRKCCDDCERGIKKLQTRQRRADKELLNPKPKKKTKREANYIWWLEYPFWINEYEMLKNTWKREFPYTSTKLSQISAAKQRAQLMGGKRKPKRVVPYNGNEEEQPKVFVQFPKRVDNKPSEVTVSHMSPEEISNYFSSKYSERHLQLERLRATTWKKF